MHIPYQEIDPVSPSLGALSGDWLLNVVFLSKLPISGLHKRSLCFRRLLHSAPPMFCSWMNSIKISSHHTGWMVGHVSSRAWLRSFVVELLNDSLDPGKLGPTSLANSFFHDFESSNRGSGAATLSTELLGSSWSMSKFESFAWCFGRFPTWGLSTLGPFPTHHALFIPWKIKDVRPCTVISSCHPTLLQLHGIESTRAEVLSI